MAHARKQIRDAVAALVTGLSTTGDRVHTGRVSNYAEHELPAINVLVTDESIEQQTIHYPAVLQRNLQARIECTARLIDGIEDELDQIALEVEHAIAASASTVSLSGILNGSIALNAVETEREENVAVPVGKITLIYAAQYEVHNNAVDTPL